uniref:Secreted protein n=1 Tax=Lutzomyia longipalpis TaxID=7200 RepID=A0A1B0C7Z0_LUTLO
MRSGYLLCFFVIFLCHNGIRDQLLGLVDTVGSHVDVYKEYGHVADYDLWNVGTPNVEKPSQEVPVNYEEITNKSENIVISSGVENQEVVKKKGETITEGQSKTLYNLLSTPGNYAHYDAYSPF